MYNAKLQEHIRLLETPDAGLSHSATTQQANVAFSAEGDTTSRGEPITIVNAQPSYDGELLCGLGGGRGKVKMIKAAAKVCEYGFDGILILILSFTYGRRREISHRTYNPIIDIADYRTSLPLSRYSPQKLINWGDSCDDIYVMRPMQRMHIDTGFVSQPAGVATHPLQEVIASPTNSAKHYLGIYQFIQEEVIHGAVYHSMPTSV
jgi:hypothetical protein